MKTDQDRSVFYCGNRIKQNNVVSKMLNIKNKQIYVPVFMLIYIMIGE